MNRNLEREREILETFRPEKTVDLHLANYFRVRKPWYQIQIILMRHKMDTRFFDPFNTPPSVSEEMWNDEFADANGNFTFRPNGALHLAHTVEELEIPGDESWRMRQYFVNEKTGEMLPLTTNISAPVLHPGASGPMTYEIINQSREPITVNTADLVCKTDIYKLIDEMKNAKSHKSTFSHQERGRIALGGREELPDPATFREAIRQRDEFIKRLKEGSI
jgi:hypothetical protein